MDRRSSFGDERRYSSSREGGDRERPSGGDEPPYSRLFVVCGKNRSMEDLRPAFEEYGTIEDMFIVKDKSSGESKGVCYVKYSTTSAAALAQEALHDTVIGSDPKPVRVMIAASRTKQTGYDVNDEKSRNRLFVVLPKGSSEKDLREAFSHFKDFETSYVVLDWKTSEPKGFGYVKFLRASSAALAMENCNSSFRALIAEPKDSTRGERGRGGGAASSHDVAAMVHPPLPPMGGSSSRSSMMGAYGGGGGGGSGPVRLYVIVNTSITQDQLARLCDVAPGMEQCDLKLVHGTRESRGFAFVTYNCPASAQFAKERLSNVEYPPGTRLVVKYAEDPPRSSAPSSSSYDDNTAGNGGGGYPDDLHRTGGGGGGGHYYDADYRRDMNTGYAAQHHHQDGNSLYMEDSRTRRHSEQDYSQDFYGDTTTLPSAAEVKSDDAGTGGSTRLFFVGSPASPPDNVLRSVFNHFGNFIDAYVVRGHNYGYARYTDEATALMAIKHLNGSEVVGNKLKVMLAEPPPRADEPRPKRTRT